MITYYIIHLGKYHFIKIIIIISQFTEELFQSTQVRAAFLKCSRITLFRGLLRTVVLLTVALCRYVEAKSHGDSGNCSWIRSSR